MTWQHQWIRCVSLVLLVFVGLQLGCKKKTDAERAVLERAKIQEKLKASWELVPYRWLKVAIRSQVDPERMRPVQEAVAALKESERLHAVEEKGVKELALLTAAYVKVAIALVKTKKDLDAHDEDTYPLVWSVWTQGPLPVGWYDNGVEHLGLAASWIAAGLAVKDLADMPFVYYELSRAEVKETWPLPLQLVGLLSCGVAFTNAQYHYAAEEELTRYIDKVEALKPIEQAALEIRRRDVEPGAKQSTVDAATVLGGARAAGYFVRAWNRIGLDRDEGATDDVEKGLAALENIGIENELTHWGWTFVHAKRGRMKKAGESLAKLARSPYLDDATRADLRKSAESLQNQGDVSGFFSVVGKGKVAIVISKALLARAGGVRGVLVFLLGTESGGRIADRLDWMKGVRDGVTKHLSVSGGIDAAKNLGGKGVDFLKEKLLRDESGDEPAAQEAKP